MFIDRDLFYRVMTAERSGKSAATNLSYVEEIPGFKRGKGPIDLFGILRRLDLFNVIDLMEATGNSDVSQFIYDVWIITSPNGDLSSWEGFDCYYPYDEQRDYLLKKFIKTRSRDGLKIEGKKLEGERAFQLNQIISCERS